MARRKTISQLDDLTDVGSSTFLAAENSPGDAGKVQVADLPSAPLDTDRVRTIAEAAAESVARGEDGEQPVYALVRGTATAEDPNGEFYGFKEVGRTTVGGGIDVTVKGDYSASETYDEGDIVKSGSDWYISQQDANTGNAVTADAWWKGLTTGGSGGGADRPRRKRGPPEHPTSRKQANARAADSRVKPEMLRLASRARTE